MKFDTETETLLSTIRAAVMAAEIMGDDPTAAALQGLLESVLEAAIESTMMPYRGRPIGEWSFME